MHIYYLLIRIAALFGHRKAKMLVAGQRETVSGERLTVIGQQLAGAIWIHAASVGEFEQAKPIIERLRATGDGVRIVVTFFSPSGYEARKNCKDVDGVYYLPFATRRNARKFLDALQPRMAIFVKYEFWPAYLKELKKRNIPTYSICAIFRPKQVFFRWWGKPYRKVLDCFTNIFVQDEASRRLLAEHGVHNASVAGDTRFDRMKEVMENGKWEDIERLKPLELFTQGCEQVIVAGSTWPKDETLLSLYIEAYPQERFYDRPQDAQSGDALHPEGKGVKLILVPHELTEEHLHYIFQLFKGQFVRYSEMGNEKWTIENGEESRKHILQQANVLLIDTMGLLSRTYRFGHVAYVGGGFGVGIHNTIEAAVYGLPVIFGPNYENFREAHGLIEHGAARSIKNYKELEAAMNTALEQHEEIGAKAAEYVQSELGATAKIFHEIFNGRN